MDAHTSLKPRSTIAWLGLIAGCTLFTFACCMPLGGDISPAGQKMLGITLLMACLWMTQGLPIEVTSLLPLVAFPLCGIMGAADVSKCYMNSNILLYFSGFVLAVGIEETGLHRRVALALLSVMGTTPSLLMLGMMLNAALLSMWMSNTAITLLMLPIAIAIYETMHDSIASQKTDDDDDAISNTSTKDMTAVDPDSVSSDNTEETETKTRLIDQWGEQFLLAIAYAASIGGMATLIGTPTNIVFQGFWNKKAADSSELISAGKWMIMFAPFALVFLIFVWRYLSWPFRKMQADPKIQHAISKRLHALGTISPQEWVMGGLFITTAFLWLTRKNITFDQYTLIYGWSGPLTTWLQGAANAGKAFQIDDSTVGMFMVALMFFVVVPKREAKAQGLGHSKEEAWSWKPIVSWETVQHKLPWGIFLLFGGGFALASGFEESKLTIWLGKLFADRIEGVPIFLIILGLCAMVTFLTEFTSNVATITTLLPILYSIALVLKIDPLILLIPATISASCAFMMPIATPPNAIVFGTGRVRMKTMVTRGIILNLVGILWIASVVYILGPPLLGIKLGE